MIDKESFRENFRYYDKNIVLQVIDIFVMEHQDRLRELETNVADIDFTAIDNNAHSFKGVLTYMSPVVAEIARKLEYKGKEKDNSGLTKLLDELRVATLQLVEGLHEIRPEYV